MREPLIQPEEPPLLGPSGASVLDDDLDLTGTADVDIAEAASLRRRNGGGPPAGVSYPYDPLEPEDTWKDVTLTMAKAILGVGVMVIPKAFMMVGLLLGSFFLLLVAAMTWFTIYGLLYAAEKTGRGTYGAVVRACCGRASTWVLLVVVIVNCFGLMSVYLVVLGDILVGTAPQHNGLLQELLPWLRPAGWYMDQKVVLAGLAGLVLTPLAVFVRLHRLGPVNVLGVASVVLLAASCVGLAVAALARGSAHLLRLLPDWGSLEGGGGWLAGAVALLGVLPVLLNASVCHQAVFPSATLLRPYSCSRMSSATGTALALCNGLYLVVALGACVAFGPSLEPDLLASMSRAQLQPLIGAAAGQALTLVLRLGYVASIVGSYVLAMHPLRHCCMELLLGHHYHQLHSAEEHVLARPLAMALVVLTYVTAVALPSIWLLLGLVGGLAATLMAFVFPPVVVLAVMRQPTWGHAAARAGAVGVLALGAAMFINTFAQFLV